VPANSAAAAAAAAADAASDESALAAAAAAPASRRTRRPEFNPYILMQDGSETRPVLQCRCGLAFALLVVSLVLLVLGATHRAGGDTPIEADARASLLYGIGGGGVALALVLLVWTAAHMRAAALRAAAEAASSSAQERTPIALQSALDNSAEADIDPDDSEQALSVDAVIGDSLPLSASSSSSSFLSSTSPNHVVQPPRPRASVDGSSAVLIVCAQCSTGFEAADFSECPLCHPQSGE
jgi:hypothetical protein